jgi:hypothetical protein
LEAALLALLTKVLANPGPPKKKIPPRTTRMIVRGMAKAGLENQSNISSMATIKNKIHPHFGIAPI